MPKDPNETTEIQPAAPVTEPIQPEFPIGIAEWCASTSQTDKRVELLGAFHAQETKLGRGRDTATAYAARLAAFSRQPA